ncbi:hypothetical protein OE749_04225 [Aestuariibacter sp. AA17]|uniref:Guanylate cyclase domain-containing protein n=1 Tax=Fluctibacter corallii TaxID=2984329 RepID=A0ABT3A5E2_9ALTE|nr:adenylate/guanylate cyclase domain-containing protein [Aestuariibacter sp. AA17]MCV2883896.1 hypothetical protein [Aestuariibacter sp. AA17]
MSAPEKHAVDTSRWFSSIRKLALVQTIAVVAICVLVLQVPLVTFIWRDNQIEKLLLLTLAVIGMTVSAVVYRQNHLISTLLLVYTYLMYITSSAFIWPFSLNMHYFLVIGVVSLPFIFSAEESPYFYGTLLVYLITLFFIEWVESVTHTHVILANFQQFTLINTVFFLVSLVLCCHYIRQYQVSQYRILNQKHRNSNRLLRRMLPSKMVTTLCNNEGAITAQYHAKITVIFADIEGFTPMCARISPHQLVSMLNTVFSVFDRTTRLYGLEKIKTNGDQYMAIGGLDSQGRNVELDSCRLAIALHQRFADIAMRLNIDLKLRIGIASGPAITGIIGEDKFSFDVWGDTVNLAAKLEKHSESDTILICEKTAKSVKNTLLISEGSEINIAGMGKITHYRINV